MSLEAMKQAADQLEIGLAYPGMRFYHDGIRAAITALRTAIAEVEKQEPVAWMYKDKYGNLNQSSSPTVPPDSFPVYTTPPAAQREWVGLTDEGCKGMNVGDMVVAMWADRILKEKNT
jgi:hypothetical protein